jgi:AbrB family looped-hinge helix DNA binding protein
MTTTDVEIAEATVTSKGQITVPGAVRKLLNLSTGDRLKFVTTKGGQIVLRPRKRRSILDIARENPIRLGDAGKNLDKLIDDAITEAVSERGRRGRGKSRA